MIKKLYMIDSKWNLGRIEEVEVIKETEKTYKIRRNSWGTNTVRKAEMSVWGYLFCMTYDEAITKTKELLIRRTEDTEKRIEKLKEDLANYKAILAEVEKEGDTE